MQKNLLQWTLGLLVTLTLSAGTLYAKWINDTLVDHEKAIRTILVSLERIETKLDLELKQHGLEVPNR